MAIERKIITRIILTHDEYANLSAKVLKEGEVALVKVGKTEAADGVSEPVWMMKVGDGNKTVSALPWLVAPAADVYAWAKKANLDEADIPALPISKISGLQSAIDSKAEKTHTHTPAQITDFDESVKTIVSGMGIAGNEEVAALSAKLTNLQTAVDETLPTQINAKVDQSTYNTKIQALEKADNDLSTAVAAAQSDASAAKDQIEKFLGDAVDPDTLSVIDTLKEIQEALTDDNTAASELLTKVTNIENGTTVVPKAKDADTVDGKHAADFATVGHNHDDYAANSHTHVIADITGLETRLSGVETTASSALQEIKTTANGGLTVTNKNQIDIDSSIVFVLDGGTADNI